MGQNGVICKVWNIQGETQSKGASAQLKDSLGYILNDEKTETKLDMAGSNINDPMAQLGRECRYIENDVKTVSGAYVGGYNVLSTDVGDAVKEMMEVKKFFNKTDGRAALHGIISLPENESNIKNASRLMQLCEMVMKEVFPDHQSIFAVHTNTENLHIHFIVNSVGLNGKKIHQDDKFMKNVLHPCVNKYARQMGFTPNSKWELKENSNMSFVDIKIMLRNAIDQAIEKSDTFDDFVKCLRNEGFTVNIGKYISIKNQDVGKAVRTQNLGSNYTKDSIVERIATRKEAFKNVAVGDYAFGETPEDIAFVSTSKLKRYKEMTPDEKKEVIKLLKLGRNPWREHSQMNWQLNNIADEINKQNRVISYVHHYSNDHTLQNALDEIIRAKKRIAAEKKLISAQKRRYKPILNIYEQMKKIEKKAYLYEHENVTEYRQDFEEYRNLTRRLKDGYGKDVMEVASFLEECDERLLYAHAQLNELSLEYREIKQYQREHGERIIDTGRLVDSIGIYTSRREEYNGTFEADAFYIAAENSDVLIRVIKTPGRDENGKIIEEYELTVISSEGEILEEIRNDNGTHAFTESVKELENKYKLEKCKRFNSAPLAKEYQKTIQSKHVEIEKNEPRASLAQSKNYTFSSFPQAINHCYNEKSHCVVLDPAQPAYTMVSALKNDSIQVTVYDRLKLQKEIVTIPLVTEKNASGYECMMELQKKYGFSDQLLTFYDEDEAREYQNQQENQRETREVNRRTDWR